MKLTTQKKKRAKNQINERVQTETVYNQS